MNCQIPPICSAYHWSVLKGTIKNAGSTNSQSIVVAQNTSVSNYYTTTLLSGAVGLLLQSDE